MGRFRRTLRFAAAAAVVAGLTATGCAEESEAPAPDAEEAELESGRIGHVHVVVQPRMDDMGPAPTVRVEARFAEYRGLDEESARVRANIPRDNAAGLAVGQCAPTERTSDLPTEIDDERELTLVDGGDLRVSIGAHDLFVPLALVPDLLPWVSGVEYVHVGEDVSALSSAPDGIVPVHLRLQGAPDDALDGFELSLDLPRRFELLPAVEAPTEDEDGALHLRWEPAGESTDLLVLQLSGFGEVAPIGAEVTCVVWDSGQTRLEMDVLEAAGLADADIIRVTARRSARAQISAGAFTNIDVVVELRDQQFVPSP